MTTKTVHLIIRDNCFIAAYMANDDFVVIRGNYRLTARGDYEAGFRFLKMHKIYSKTMTGLKQKIRLTIRNTYYNNIVN